MESVIISSENVRPSSPTPQNLRTYKFSMLDQLGPSLLVPFVLFFSNNNTSEISDTNLFISQTTQQLKRSLSVILTRFYPLAGRVDGDGQSIDCDDQGVPFVVVKFTGQKLSDVLRNINIPEQKLLGCLLPCEIRWGANYGPDSSVALIQVNYFDCGGIAVGAVFAHKVADGVTIANFLNSWAAATSRGSKQAVCPNYIFQSIFPHKEELHSQSPGSTDNLLKTGKSVVKRYVFDAAAISSLKSKAGGVQRPTRVEVVSALIWKCFIAASLANNMSAASVATHAVDLRRRAHPPFPSDCFGNFLGVAVARSSSTENGNADLGRLVTKLRDAVSKQDDFIDMLRASDRVISKNLDEDIQVMWSQLLKDADMLGFTSWCSLGLYTTDFGWGNPIWIAKCDIANHPNLRFVNSVWLMDTRNGDGIEAWVVLDENYMSVFENVEELRALASVDPSPLDI